MDFSLVFNEIIVLFIIILLGYILKKKEMINAEISKGLSDLLVEITMPALIISSMHVQINPDIVVNMQLISILTAAVYIFAIFFSYAVTWLTPIPDNKKNVFIFMIVFGNVGFMGYPVLGVIYPEYGIFYGLFNNIAFNLLVWTFGVYLFTSTRGEKYEINWKYLLNNGILSVLIGFVLLFSGWQLPAPVLGALDMVGEMTYPLSMLIIGSSLAGVHFIKIFTDKYILLLTILKLLFIPGLLYFSLLFIDLPPIVSNVTIILTAMPCAANSVVFAEKFDRDHQFASRGVFMTTLLSLATLPIFLLLLG